MPNWSVDRLKHRGPSGIVQRVLSIFHFEYNNYYLAPVSSLHEAFTTQFRRD